QVQMLYNGPLSASLPAAEPAIPMENDAVYQPMRQVWRPSELLCLKVTYLTDYRFVAKEVAKLHIMIYLYTLNKF
ncbi:MAG: hypothetical protein ACKOCO_05925, partial [Bacteroidota bacterium]